MPKFVVFKFLPALVASLVFAPLLAAAAEALVKPVPMPDLSKTSPAVAQDLRDSRQEFEKLKPTLVGDALAQAHAMLGAAYARAGFYDAAAVALDDAAQLAPSDARWVYAQGVVARMQKQNAVAQGYFERALVLNQEYLPIRMAVVNLRIEQGDLENARKLLSDYTAAHNNEPVAFAMLGDIALRQKRYAEAIEQTNRALALDAKATKLYAQLADAYTGAGNAKAAADARAKAGEGMPSLGDPIGLGLVEASAAPGTGTPAQQAAAPSSGAANLPSDPRSKAMVEASFLLATRQYDAARLRLDDALKAYPNDADLLSLYARAEASSGHLAQAKARAQAAVAAAPNNARAQLMLGYVLEMVNDDAAAQRAYEKAASLDPKLDDANLSAGNLLMRSGRYDEAASKYRAATQTQPGNSEAWSRLAAAEVSAGKCPAALKDVNGALAKDANNGILLQLFVRLTSTCAAGGPEEKRMALDYAGKMYRQSDAAPIGETFALALAANGKWDDAVKTQQAAMFVLVRNGHKRELTAYRQFLLQFQAHKVPERPWAADNVLLLPPRPAPDPVPAAAPAAAPPPAKK